MVVTSLQDHLGYDVKLPSSATLFFLSSTPILLLLTYPIGVMGIFKEKPTALKTVGNLADKFNRDRS